MQKVFLLLLAASAPALAADQWIKLTTPDFELYTSAGEKKGREAIAHFEQVRDFFLKASPVKQTSESRVRIIEFTTMKQYLPYGRDENTPAFFTSSPSRDYIVIGDASLDFSIATHEYTHLVVKRSGLRLPVWLNEGWADVYSSLRPMGKGAAIGDLLEGRMRELKTATWLDFDTLTSVTHASPVYNEASRAGIFYAESWALAHMLYLSPDYQANFGKFVMALHQGKTSAEACQIAWGRSSEQVFTDLRAYLDRKKIFGRVFETRLDKARQEPSVTPVAEFDTQLMLTDLLAAAGKLAEAKAAYAELEKQAPARGDLARSMGYLAAQMSDREGARTYLARAFDAGESDARMCFDLAALESAARLPPARILAVLERAVQSDPGFTDAQLQLGLTKIAIRDFAGAIVSLNALSNISPDRAPAVFCGLSLAYAHTGDLAAAKETRDTCARWAKSENSMKSVKELTRFIDARSTPEAAVHPGEQLKQVAGTARNMDCSAKPKRLTVQGAGGPMVFDVPDADAVELTHGSGGALNLSCGPLQPFRINVEYAPPRSAMQTTTGIVRRLEF